METGFRMKFVAAAAAKYFISRFVDFFFWMKKFDILNFFIPLSQITRKPHN